jgi:hypothetical protein
MPERGNPATELDRPAHPGGAQISSAVELKEEKTPDAKNAEEIWRWAKRQAIVRMDLSFGARECWRILEAFSPDSCFPSHWYIAETLRRSSSAVRRYLRELKQGRYIDIVARRDEGNIRQPRSTRRPRGQTSNNYVLLDQPDLIAVARQIVQEWYAKQKRSNG